MNADLEHRAEELFKRSLDLPTLRTANREWAYARAWLHKRLSDGGSCDQPTSTSAK